MLTYDSSTPHSISSMLTFVPNMFLNPFIHGQVKWPDNQTLTKFEVWSFWCLSTKSYYTLYGIHVILLLNTLFYQCYHLCQIIYNRFFMVILVSNILTLSLSTLFVSSIVRSTQARIYTELKIVMSRSPQASSTSVKYKMTTTWI